MSPVTQALHPGDVACVARGHRLQTLLGSCVAILLTDPRGTLGAMCHLVHAGAPTAPSAAPDTAYGADALAEMGRLLRERGIDPSQCLAWVFGGGHMFPGQDGAEPEADHVGAANAEWALNALEEAGIRLLGADIGGHAYRKLSWAVGDEPPAVETTLLTARRRPAREHRA